MGHALGGAGGDGTIGAPTAGGDGGGGVAGRFDSYLQMPLTPEAVVPHATLGELQSRNIHGEFSATLPVKIVRTQQLGVWAHQVP